MADAKTKTTKAAVAEEKAEPVKVTMRAAAPIQKDEVKTEVPAESLTVHHELSIAPPDHSGDVPAPADPAGEVAPVTEEKPTETAQETPKPAETMIENPKPPVDDAPKQAPNPVAQKPPLGTTDQKEVMQSPKVFDTKQYHLPIEEGSSGSSAKYLVIFLVVFFAIVIVGGLLAIDAGWLDLGFKLPFDLIK